MPRPSRRALERAARTAQKAADTAAWPSSRGDPGRRPRPRIRAHRRRWRFAALLSAVRASLAAAPRWQGRPYVIAEDLAVELRARPDAIARCLQLLNLEGLVSQPVHHAPGDTPRAGEFSGTESAWAADVYWVREPAAPDMEDT